MPANRTYADLAVGDEATARRICTADDLLVFAHASGNLNPLHLPGHDKDRDGRDDAIAPSMWVGALVSAVLGNVLPGPGTRYRAQSFTFGPEPVLIGDELVVSVRVIEKLTAPLVRLATQVRRPDGTVVADGVAEVLAPTVRTVFSLEDVPDLIVQRHQHFDRLIEACAGLEAVPTAVVWPEDPNSLAGAMLARDKGLIRPLLLGDEDAIRSVARLLDVDIGSTPVIACEDDASAAARAVAMVHEGSVRAIMKGNLHTDVLLGQVLKTDGGLRMTRRVSHVFVLDVPGLDHPLLISDAAINIAPDLEAKVSIVQNAIDVARAIGIETPRVGILSAVETVNPKIPSTLDAAILSKMAERGQIEGGLVDGPLAMDNAIDMEAARTKGIKSLVAGRADILIVPNLESGNMLAKQLTFVAHAEAAGLVVGARVPVILTSRADNARARLISCALAILYDRFRRKRTPAVGRLAKAAG